MGFFSWKCKCCERSLRSEYATKSDDRKMGTAVLENGSVVHGEYDGYGRLLDDGNEFELPWDAKVDVYHTKCWKEAGSPTEFTGGSYNAEDQGFFFAPGDPDYGED